ncbi:MAG: hypothetical protein AAGU21_06765 [Solidesulfovibrio sp.]|uniref:hypothetical protein n=1 Tax=Solidesulfovibrio sp. TaxID=2910990 RepID=UPI002B21D2D8|nr:hypothetical protein [Solidesulfovibrio sp.]MEA4856589.1 hypothetical protein [Solidesulfovibrio sp.]
MRCVPMGLALAAAILAAWPGSAPAGDPARELAEAKRLACAYTHGIHAGFNPQGGVSIKPPLDPNTPGLTIDILDRAKKQAVLEEDDRETPGVLGESPMGLSVVARYADGGLALVTVFPVYSGASDSFLMVASHHEPGTMPRMRQRYGLCRLAEMPPPAAPAPPPPAKKGHP